MMMYYLILYYIILYVRGKDSLSLPAANHSLFACKKLVDAIDVGGLQSEVQGITRVPRRGLSGFPGSDGDSKSSSKMRLGSRWRVSGSLKPRLPYCTQWHNRSQACPRD